MNPKELYKRDFARIRRKIAKFNEDLARYVKTTESNEVPDIDCTIIGTSPMNPIEVKEIRKGISYADDGFWQDITIESECGEYWLSGEDELDDVLKYNRRRLRKGWRVWHSDNPDKELETDIEE